jgi:hypothetical protein
MKTGMLTVLTYKHYLAVISSGRGGKGDKEQQKKLEDLSKKHHCKRNSVVMRRQKEIP